MVKIDIAKAPAESKCCGCYRIIKRGEDVRYKIITYKKDMILCESCYNELMCELEGK